MMIIIPELAKQIATAFVQDQTIIAVVGHNDSNLFYGCCPHLSARWFDNDYAH